MADPLEDAKQWVADGDKAEAAHDYTTAIAKYRQALGVRKSAQLFLRLGLAQEEQGSVADAMRSYEAARPLATDNDVLTVVTKQLDEVRQRVGYVSITMPAAPPSVRVDINGQGVADPSADTAVNPGDVDVHGAAPGRSDVSKHVQIASGQHIKVELAFGAGANVPPQNGTPPTSSAHPSIPGIVMLSVGVVGLAVGAGVLGQGFIYQSDLDAKCKLVGGQYTGCPATIDGLAPQDLSSKSNTFKIAGGVTLGAGAALGVVGGVLLGLSLGRHAPANAMVVPIVGPTVAGAAFATRF